MRGLRERPRVIAAQVLVFAAVLGGGILVGMALDDDPTVPPATQKRLDRAEREAVENAELLRIARNDLGRSRDAARRVQTLAAENRHLRRRLARARRALRRALRRAQD